MMQLRCPWCGPRPESEFRCGGATGVTRPPLDCDDQAWADYLFVRDNLEGAHAERWHHGQGCGLWFNIVRNTVTHEVSAVWSVSGPKPEEAG